MAEIAPDNSRLGVSFHRTFALRRAGIIQVLELALEQECARPVGSDAELDYESVWASTSLGTVDAQASCRYAFGVGLLDKHYLPTGFGRLAYTHDPGLVDTRTQWILHYHLVAPHGNGPSFWGHLVTTLLRPGESLSPQSVADEVGRFVEAQECRILVPRTCRATATVFLGTYAKSDGLAGLGILEEPGPGETEYRVGEPEPPPWRVVAYVLSDYWEGVWGGRKTVNLSSVLEPGGPASLLLLNSGEMNMLLRKMQAEGLVELQRRVPPFQVVRLWESSAALLEGVYD